MFFGILLITVLNLGLSINDNAPNLNLVNNLSLNSTKPKTQQAATQTSPKAPLYLTAAALTTSAIASAVTIDIALSSQQNLPIMHQGSKSVLSPPSLQPTVLATEAYNQDWFTQGLYKDREGFYISSGLYNKSILIYQSTN